jgi:hypothetical protein
MYRFGTYIAPLQQGDVGYGVPHTGDIEGYQYHNGHDIVALTTQSAEGLSVLN